MKKIISITLATLIIALGVFMTGCASKSYKQTQSKLEKAGYSVAVDDNAQNCAEAEEFFDIEKGSFVAKIIAEKDDDYVYVYFCSNKKTAEIIYEFTEQLKSEADQEAVKNDVVEQKGNRVYLGTAQGIKDAQ